MLDSSLSNYATLTREHSIFHGRERSARVLDQSSKLFHARLHIQVEYIKIATDTI